ncbi:NnrS family protein [Pseudoalteromonas sp. OOF1S-7]|uniref:NnrS family protein n=1 Tax=Pseudoalteromonas sp. OOF1S-7 TaxID=2917757 RepID=UPI001EF55ECD|nr:NnrS family protein [Pseudoalteromonas sp. OOF1S-7]MCG7533456.1 NnrS family protein [Pseudoalteromonas sp. OOF1S-7]
MMQILDTQKEEQIPPVLRLAFRPFFLLGGFFSCLALIVWGCVLSGTLQFTPYGHVLFWHSHEMLFGFVSAIVVGFLLTAVQNWTGIPSIRGRKLAVLAGLWIAARVLMLFSSTPPWLVILVDLLFLPLAGYWLAKPIIAIGQMRNLFFVPILVFLSATNLIMHLGVVLNLPSLYQHGYISAIWLITLLMSILGGRVIPFFTANGTKTEKVTPIRWLEYLTLGMTWGIFAVYITGLNHYLPEQGLGGLMLLCALAHVIRVQRWKFRLTLKVPLLWSLHAAYWFIPIGIALIGISYLSDMLTLSTAFHALTVGAMGSMILSMMSRVSLGHTGRKLVVRQLVVVAFGAVFVSALIRVFGILFFASFSFTFVLISIVTWCIAYGLFTLVYYPVLTQPRADGRPG